MNIFGPAQLLTLQEVAARAGRRAIRRNRSRDRPTPPVGGPARSFAARETLRTQRGVGQEVSFARLGLRLSGSKPPLGRGRVCLRYARAHERATQSEGGRCHFVIRTKLRKIRADRAAVPPTAIPLTKHVDKSPSAGLSYGSSKPRARGPPRGCRPGHVAGVSAEPGATGAWSPGASCREATRGLGPCGSGRCSRRPATGGHQKAEVGGTAGCARPRGRGQGRIQLRQFWALGVRLYALKLTDGPAVYGRAVEHR